MVYVVQDKTRCASFSQEEPKILNNNQQTNKQMKEKNLGFTGSVITTQVKPLFLVWGRKTPSTGHLRSHTRTIYSHSHRA